MVSKFSNGDNSDSGGKGRVGGGIEGFEGLEGYRRVNLREALDETVLMLDGASLLTSLVLGPE